MPRSDAITFRVSPQERSSLEAEATAADRSLGWVIRSKLFPTAKASNVDAARTTLTATISPEWTDPQPPDPTGAAVPRKPKPGTGDAKQFANPAQAAQAQRDEMLKGFGSKKK